jgi:hypothetical protein
MLRLGIHQTGCVVGALRVLQSWNFASILVEVSPSASVDSKLTSSTGHIQVLGDTA